MKNLISIAAIFFLIFIFKGSILYGTELSEIKVMKITQSEAINIAQNLMREKGLDKDWNILKPKIKYDDDKEIGIKFFSRHRFALNLKMALPYLIVISKADGSVVAFGQDK